MKFAVPESIPRAALITGGARHPGIAAALADAGFRIALQCHPGDEPDVRAGVVLLSADLSDETDTASLLGRAGAALGEIGVLVNAASTCEGDTRDDAARATWDMHIATNLRAPFLLIRQFAATLPIDREGVVINLLDQRICPRLVSYTLSKAALWTLTQTMALSLAPTIRVNGIAAVPGADPDTIGRAVLAILALASMTGQMIVPDGLPPS